MEEISSFFASSAQRNESGLVKTSKTRDSNNFESEWLIRLCLLKTVNKGSIARFYLIFALWTRVQYELYTRPMTEVPNRTLRFFGRIIVTQISLF